MDKTKFRSWLETCGAELLAPTNPYEIARFVARGQTNIVYQGRRGISAAGFAAECVDAFEAGKPISMGFAKKGGSHAGRLKHALFQRDGDACFFCGKAMQFDEATIEHLVGRMRGGTDHIDNLALAHQPCNQSANNLPLMKKIKMRDDLRKA